MSELAQYLSRAQSTISEIIERWTAQKLVARMQDTTDARRSLIWLTCEGKDAFSRASTPLDPKHIEAMSSRLSKAERDELLRLFKKLTERDNG